MDSLCCKAERESAQDILPSNLGGFLTRCQPVILFDLCKGLRGFEAIFFFIFVIYYKIFVPLHTMLAIRTDQV